jgi:hypothetical protein
MCHQCLSKCGYILSLEWMSGDLPDTQRTGQNKWKNQLDHVLRSQIFKVQVCLKNKNIKLKNKLS